MSCIEQMKYKLLLERTSFKEARQFIEKNADEVYYVDPGLQDLQRLLHHRCPSYRHRR